MSLTQHELANQQCLVQIGLLLSVLIMKNFMQTSVSVSIFSVSASQSFGTTQLSMVYSPHHHGSGSFPYTLEVPTTMEVLIMEML